MKPLPLAARAATVIAAIVGAERGRQTVMANVYEPILLAVSDSVVTAGRSARWSAFKDHLTFMGLAVVAEGIYCETLALAVDAGEYSEAEAEALFAEAVDSYLGAVGVEAD